MLASQLWRHTCNQDNFGVTGRHTTLPTGGLAWWDSHFSQPSLGFFPGLQFSCISPDLWQIFTLFFLFVITTCFWHCTACISPMTLKVYIFHPDNKTATLNVVFWHVRDAEESCSCLVLLNVWETEREMESNTRKKYLNFRRPGKKNSRFLRNFLRKSARIF